MTCCFCEWFPGAFLQGYLIATETPPLICLGFCCDCHSDLNTPSSPANQNNFGLFSACVFLPLLVTRATKKTLQSLQTDVTMKERLWLDMPYLVPSGLLLTLTWHVFQEWIRLQEVAANIPCHAGSRRGWVLLSSSPAQCLALSPLRKNRRGKSSSRQNWLDSWSCKCCCVSQSWNICF